MTPYNLYIHGTPYGHQIWGSQVNHDYIGRFYNHDAKPADNVMLQIDICRGDTYYTYVRQNNVYDAGGRPNAFFAMTVCFPKSYCSNVYKLYQLFEAIYRQVCVGKFVRENNGQVHYIVKDLESAQSGAQKVVSHIQSIFEQKTEEMLLPFITPLPSGSDTYNQPKRSFNIMEVDSPYFNETMLKSSLIVSPGIELAATALQEVSKVLQNVSSQKTALEASNAQLKSSVASLSDDNKSLSEQLANATSSADKKHRGTIKKLEIDLKRATDERDSLKKKIEEATSSIELIDKPFQKLTRLLAGRFPETDKKRFEDDDADKPKTSRKYTHPSWSRWINRVLLLGIFILCAANLYFLTQYKPLEPSKDVQPGIEVAEIKVEDPVTNDSTTVRKPENPSYDDFSLCFINIIGGGDEVSQKKNYPLKIYLKGQQKEANVPEGTWRVLVSANPEQYDDNLIANGSDLIISKDYTPGTNLIIKYFVDNIPVIQRPITIKK